MEPNVTINNDLYHEMDEHWYDAEDHPIALLRQESRRKNEWIHERLKQRDVRPRQARILDVGCGAGFLCNHLAKLGYDVTGVDAAEAALKTARRHDSTASASYVQGDAGNLPFHAGRFDVVTSLDFLEHVENPEAIVHEISRVLKPGGLFFFHTFNKHWLAYLIAIKGVEWFVANTPKHLHLYSMFIRPKDLSEMCVRARMVPEEWTGLRPQLNRSFFRMLRTGRVDDGFQFCETKSLKISYMGLAVKDPRVQF